MMAIKKTSVRVDPELYEQMKPYLVRFDITFSRWLRMSMADWVRDRERQERWAKDSAIEREVLGFKSW
jgi:hypothetical protein